MKKYFFVVIVFATISTIGQTWTSYTTTEGLINNKVKAVASDISRGLMWFATDKGVSSFDGTTWKSYEDQGSGPVEFTSGTLVGGNENKVKSIFVDSNDNVWFGTKKSIWKYDGTTWYLFNKTTNPSDGNTYSGNISNNVVNGISEDTTGRMWFATKIGGSLLYDVLGTITWKNFDLDNLNLGPNVKVNAVSCSSNGDVWFGTDAEGAYLLQNGNDPLVAVNWDNYTIPNLIDDKVKAIDTDSNNHVWFGTDVGVSEFDNATTWTDYLTSDGLVHDKVKAVFVDSDDFIWFGTNGGVSRYDNFSVWTTYTNANTSGGLINNKIKGISFDANTGNFWFATDGGVSKLSGIILSIKDVTQNEISLSYYPNPHNKIVTIKFDEQYNQVLFTLVDVKGQIVKKDKYRNKNIIKVDMSVLSKGIYFGKIVTEKVFQRLK